MKLEYLFSYLFKGSKQQDASIKAEYIRWWSDKYPVSPQNIVSEGREASKK